MAEGDFGVDFFMEWADIPDPKMSLKEKERTPRKSRLAGETKEQRERRLSRARECSARRRSIENREDREKRLKDQRERMSEKRHSETPEERNLRLQKARERECTRRKNETLDERERRLQYSREKAAIRRNEETPEEREKRLDSSRIRASQRRREKKLSRTSESSSAESVSNSEASAPEPSRSMNKRVMRQTVQNRFYTTTTDGDIDGSTNNISIYKDSCGDSTDEGNYFSGIPKATSSSLSTDSSSAGLTSDPIRAEVTQSHSLEGEEGGSREEGGGGGLLGGIGLGFLERRHNHPDFNLGDQRIVVVKNI